MIFEKWFFIHIIHKKCTCTVLRFPFTETLILTLPFLFFIRRLLLILLKRQVFPKEHKDNTIKFPVCFITSCSFILTCNNLYLYRKHLNHYFGVIYSGKDIFPIFAPGQVPHYQLPPNPPGQECSKGKEVVAVRCGSLALFLCVKFSDGIRYLLHFFFRQARRGWQ